MFWMEYIQSKLLYALPKWQKLLPILEQYLLFTDIISTGIVIQIYYLPSRSTSKNTSRVYTPCHYQERH